MGVRIMAKIKHDHKCQNCGKPATKNLQYNWQLFAITPSGNFKEEDTWEGDSSEFFCDECYDKEMSITN